MTEADKTVRNLKPGTPEYDRFIQHATLHNLARMASNPCECPRPENASGDRECTPCKARRAVSEFRFT